MGVLKTIKTPGDGKHYPKRGDKLTVHYTGWYGERTVFGSSVELGRPLEFLIGVGMVIRGWDEGMMKMSVGEKAELKITSDFAYGERGLKGYVEPNTDVWFEVELLAIN